MKDSLHAWAMKSLIKVQFAVSSEFCGKPDFQDCESGGNQHSDYARTRSDC